MRRQRLIPAAAAAILGIMAAAALAATHSATLRVRQNVHDDNASNAAFRVKAVNKFEAVAIGAAGYPVYTFQGETTHHIICKMTSNAATNCWAFWPPVSVSSANGLSKQAGIRGTLGSFRIHGIRQLTLNGQPLYYFTPDLQSGNKHQATGDELKTFGSIWHVVVAHVGGAAGPQTPAATGMTPTGSPSPNPYPGW